MITGKQIKIRKKHNILLYEGIGAFLVTMGILQSISETMTRNYLLMALVFVASFVIVHYGILNYSKRRLKCSLFYCIPFGLAFWVGQKVIYQSAIIKDFAAEDVLLILVFVALFTLMSMCVLGFIDRRVYKPVKKMAGEGGQWWIYSLIILLCWIPLFLAFFPGIVSVDSAVQLRQAVGEGAWSNWHPVLHTLFVAVPVNIGMSIFGGDLTAGIALSTLLQMLLLSAIFGYVIKWVMELTQKKWIGYLLMAFFGICPIVACYAVTMWKDVLFSAVFLLLFVKLYDLVNVKRRGEFVRFGDLWPIFLLTLLTGFLRNGGAIIVFVLLAVMWIYYKQSWKIVLVGFGGVIIIIMMIQGLVYKILNISSSPLMESLSVPAQQFAYLANSEKMDDRMKEELAAFGSVDCLAEHYEPMNADPAKNCFDYNEVNNNKIGFLTIWAKYLPNYLPEYIKAYVLHSYAYWYIQGDVWALDFAHTHDEIWLKTSYNDKSLIGDTLKEMVEMVEKASTMVVWGGWINNVGIMFWGVFYMLMVFVYQKRYEMLIPLSGILAYMISLLVASPVSWIFRYVYSLLLIMPILMIVCFINIKKLKGDMK